ncbi:hypothetical protein BE18_41630 [Sorangium cellulosum]|uniref:Uncharacterized protein n=1 Tax=Sorangium cellulosum TaxID=56 RepID=A0A150T1V0_SORCE|nr:hypothetical protein BE18_41630 [Sorangium cellulosum]
MLHASLPGEATAWLTVAQSGAVIRYVEEGEREPFGVWLGCGVTPRAHQTCTLVTHLLGLRIRKLERQTTTEPVGLGFGSGLGFGAGAPFP